MEAQKIIQSTIGMHRQSCKFSVTIFVLKEDTKVKGSYRLGRENAIKSYMNIAQLFLKANQHQINHNYIITWLLLHVNGHAPFLNTEVTLVIGPVEYLLIIISVMVALTHKQLEIHRCILRTVATVAKGTRPSVSTMLTNYQLYQFHTKVIQL